MSRLQYEFAPIKVWPPGWDPNVIPDRISQFTGSWESTQEILARELDYLGARQIQFQVAVKDAQVRRDGMLRAETRVDYPGVILSFTTEEFGTLTYPCNAFRGGGWKGREGWKDNIRAIALGLEALRKVERYGIANRGQQYAGWRELGSGMAVDRMTEDRAWEILCEAAGVEITLAGADNVERVWREASKRHHPDVGGDSDYFKLITEAREMLT
jgi:hypothetical protein